LSGRPPLNTGVRAGRVGAMSVSSGAAPVMLSDVD